MLKQLGVLLVLLAGCDLYWNGGGGDDVCNGAVKSGGAPAYEVRDPLTGQCQYIGGGYDCGGCGPCEATPPSTYPNWPACAGTCESITTAAQCEATAGCHAAFLSGDVGIGGKAPGFYGCFDIQPLPVLDGGACNTFDAYTCTQHEDCVSNYAPSSAGTPSFASCGPEGTTVCGTDSDCGPGAHCDMTGGCYPQPGCGDCAGCGACPDVCYGVCVADDPCAAIDCGTGSHCESQCYPCDTPGPNGCMDTCSAMCVPDTTCANVDCGPGYTCAEVCDAGTNGKPGSCYPTCLPTGNDPGDCTGSVTCTTAPPACPAGSTAGIANGCYTGYCIPLTDCGPKDPGTCTGTVTCGDTAPACPAGTTAGIKNGCWSGYCIPDGNCPLAACETLTTEAACSARGDCLPVYDGSNCTCYPDGHCECQVVTFARCETLMMPL